jgi:hypothetical protein
MCRSVDRNLRRRAIPWLLAAVMPFQLLAAVYLDVLGPAHFHEDDADDHHPHRHIERHHHDHDDASVVTIRDGLAALLAMEEESAAGWSSTMLAALPAGDLPALAQAQREPIVYRQAFLQSFFPGRLERPPRAPHA